MLYQHEVLLDEAALYAQVWPCLEPLVRQNLPLMVSDEELSGLCFWNSKQGQAPDMLGVLQRMQRFFRRVKVLIVFREPEQFLRAYYYQMLKMGYNVVYPIFISGSLQREREVIQALYLDRLWYKARAAGIELTLLPLEALKHEPQAFFKAVSEFFGLPFQDLPHLNTTPPEQNLRQLLQDNLKRLRNLGLFTPLHEVYASEKWLQQAQQNADWELYALPETLQAPLTALSVRCNTQLQKILAWDLAAYGYRLEF